MSDANQKILEVQSLYNDGQYEEAVELFDQYASSFTADELPNFDKYRGLKIRALMVFAEDYNVVEEEIDYLNKHYADNEEIMIFTVKLLQNLQAFEEALKLKSNIRMVIATQCEIAKSNNPALFFPLLQKFEQQPSTPRDKTIKLTLLKEGQKFTFNQDHIKALSVNKDLPNDNYYINFTIQYKDLELNANIPGPANDGICETGSLKIKSVDETSLTINRYEVTEYLMVSPFGIQVVNDEISLIINNVTEF